LAPREPSGAELAAAYDRDLVAKGKPFSRTESAATEARRVRTQNAILAEKKRRFEEGRRAEIERRCTAFSSPNGARSPA
jgi:hypothetical protein